MAKTFNGKRPQNLGKSLRRILAYLGRHKILLMFVGVLAAVSASANLIGTYMIKPIVNQVTESGTISGLVRNVAIAALIFGTGALSTLGYTQIMVRAAQKVLCDIRRDLYAHLQKLPLEFFDAQRKGDLMSLFTNDVDTISDALNNSFAMIIQSFIQIVADPPVPAELEALFPRDPRLWRNVLLHPFQHQKEQVLLQPPSGISR